MKAITKNIAANSDARRIMRIPEGMGSCKIDRPRNTANVMDAAFSLPHGGPWRRRV
jgi:hypothetical protein